MGSMFGPALAGVSIGIIGVHWSMCVVFGCTLFAMFWLAQMAKFTGY